MNNNFERIGVFTNSRKSHVAKTIARLLPILLERRGNISYFSPTSINFSGPAQHLDEQQLIRSSDLLIVVGGDGNFLKAARVALDSQARLLGVNCGRLGFLTDLDPDKLEQEIGGILEGNYLEDQRSLLATELDGSKQFALNDIVIRGHGGRMADIKIYINGAVVTHLRCDGIVIATPTGSTAYALAAGGPLLPPSMPAFVIAPIAAHALNSRPIVVNDSSEITLSLHSQANLWLDGVSGSSLKSNSVVNIRKAQKSICIVHPQTYAYFDVCRQKLGWNVGIKLNS